MHYEQQAGTQIAARDLFLAYHRLFAGVLGCDCGVDYCSKFNRIAPMTDQEYRYFGTMVGIVDGDTFDIDVDLGFSTRRKERFRLLGSAGGVNTPEMNSRDPAERIAAIAAKARAAELVPIGRQVLIMTKMDKMDGFRRYLAQIVTLAGVNLGDALLAEGHAKVWIG